MCRRGTLNWATDVVFTFVYLWSSAIHSYVQTIIYGRNSRPDNWLITHSVSHKYSTVRTYVRTYVFMYVYVCVCACVRAVMKDHILKTVTAIGLSEAVPSYSFHLRLVSVQSSINIYCQASLSSKCTLTRFVHKNSVLIPCVHLAVIHAQSDVVIHILLW